MNMEQTTENCKRDATDATLHIIRDMILLALDETETTNLPEVNRLSARAALAEALDTLEAAQ